MQKTQAHARKLAEGDIVEVEWYDTHATERLTHEDIEDLEDPTATVAYGIVLRNSPRYLAIASEICLDPWSDGGYIEQIPHGTISRVRKMGRRSLNMETEDAEGRL